MIEAILALSGLAFWTVVTVTILWCFVVTALAEFNRPVWTTTLLIAMVYGLVSITRYPLWATIKSDPLLAVYWILGYIGVAAMWSVFKWSRKVSKQVKKWAASPYSHHKELVRNIKESNGDFELHVDIDPAYHKSQFYAWGVVWPLSMVWTLFDDPLRAIFDFLYDQFGEIYTKVARSVARRIASSAKI